MHRGGYGRMKKILNTLFGFIPHILIVLSLMMITFYITDRQNRAMAFINNDITKALLLAMSILVLIESVYLIVHLRKKQADEYRKYTEDTENNK